MAPPKKNRSSKVNRKPKTPKKYPAGSRTNVKTRKVSSPSSKDNNKGRGATTKTGQLKGAAKRAHLNKVGKNATKAAKISSKARTGRAISAAGRALLGKGPIGTALGVAALGAGALASSVKGSKTGSRNPRANRSSGKAHTIKTTNQRGQPVALALNRYDKTSPKKVGTSKVTKAATGTPKPKSKKTVGPVNRVTSNKARMDYPVYKKSSAEAGSFRSAYSQARAAKKAGKSVAGFYNAKSNVFTWKGKKYKAESAGEKSRRIASKSNSEISAPKVKKKKRPAAKKFNPKYTDEL